MRDMSRLVTRLSSATLGSSDKAEAADFGISVTASVVHGNMCVCILMMTSMVREATVI